MRAAVQVHDIVRPAAAAAFHLKPGAYARKRVLVRLRATGVFKLARLSCRGDTRLFVG